MIRLCYALSSLCFMHFGLRATEMRPEVGPLKTYVGKIDKIMNNSARLC